jgi:hypothetical protein
VLNKSAARLDLEKGADLMVIVEMTRTFASAVGILRCVPLQ